MAISKHLKLKNYACIVTFAPSLQGASFHSATDFLSHSTTIKLLPLLVLITGSYPNLRTSQRC